MTYMRAILREEGGSFFVLSCIRRDEVATCGDWLAAGGTWLSGGRNRCHAHL